MADTASQGIDHSTTDRAGIRKSNQVNDKARITSSDTIARACLLALERYKSAKALAVTIARTAQTVFGCERITIVQIESGKSAKSRILTLSDQIDIDSRRQLPLRISQALRETAISEDALVVFSAASSSEIASRFPAHKELYEQSGQCPVFSFCYPLKHVNSTSRVPAYAQTRIGVLVEHREHRGFSRQELKALHAALSPLLNLLLLQLHTERSWVERLALKFKALLNLQSYRMPTIKQGSFMVASVLLLAGFIIQVPVQVKAQAVMQAKDSQVLIAPHTGFVSASHVRAGDRVERNQTLASLDTRDLLLTQAKWNSELTKNEQAVDVALADRDRVSLGKLRADAKRIEAELALIEHRLARAEILAPFDGVVLSGDLSQLLGASVQQGDVLFTIASDAQYQLVLNVDEYDVGLLHVDQTARIRMAALPGKTFDATIQSVLPMAVTVGESNSFQVPTVLEQGSDQLRTGMEGIARITTGQGSLIAVYTRDLRESLTRIFWRLGLID